MLKYFLVSVYMGCAFVSGLAQTCNPNDPYDQIVSDFHSSVARRQDGSLVVWGENKASSGNTHVLTPQVIDSINYPGLTGIPLKAALASNSIDISQAILLTTTGLFVWGKPGIIIPSSNPAFAKIVVDGKADGLPPGVFPKNVKILTATHMSLGILTDSGEVWIMGSRSSMYGDNSQTVNNKWHQVKSAISPNLNLQNIVQLRLSPVTAFAVDAQNNWYTWGSIFTNGLPIVNPRMATICGKPEGYVGTIPKMIGVNSSTSPLTSTYFVIDSVGKLYSMGDNRYGILGNGSITNRNTWGPVMKNEKENFENVSFITVQESDANFIAVAAITTDNNLWAWGSNHRAILGAPESEIMFRYPRTPNGFNYNVDKATYAELGGHTLVYVKDGHDRYCYVGHRVNGSMGDGTATDAVETSMNCTNTAAVPLCSFCPKTANNKISRDQDVCEEEPIDDIEGAVATLSNNDVLSYQWLNSTQSETEGYKVIENATSQNLITPSAKQTTWFRRLVKNSTQECPGDTSRAIRISIHQLPKTPKIAEVYDVCLGDSLTLSATAANDVTYTWRGPDGFTSNSAKLVLKEVKTTQSGIYRVGVIDPYSCASDYAATELRVHTIELEINSPDTLCEGRTLELELLKQSPDYSYSWKGPDGFTTTKKSLIIESIEPEQAGLYALTIQNSVLCRDSIQVEIWVKICQDTSTIDSLIVPGGVSVKEPFSIPEGFSPNNDGQNDLFKISGLSNYPNNSIVIFNRWGQKVYEAAPYKNDWRGENKFGLVVTGSGDMLPEGTYYYLLDKNNGESPVKGSVYLKK